jgi:hypothetical protein
MPDFTTEIEIEPWEYVNDCSSEEVEELIECLHNDGSLKDYFAKHGVIDPDSVIQMQHNGSLLDVEWTEVIVKLSRNRLILTTEEEEIIKKIAQRLI